MRGGQHGLPVYCSARRKSRHRTLPMGDRKGGLFYSHQNCADEIEHARSAVLDAARGTQPRWDDTRFFLCWARRCARVRSVPFLVPRVRAVVGAAVVAARRASAKSHPRPRPPLPHSPPPLFRSPPSPLRLAYPPLSTSPPRWGRRAPGCPYSFTNLFSVPAAPPLLLHLPHLPSFPTAVDPRVPVSCVVALRRRPGYG